MMRMARLAGFAALALVATSHGSDAAAPTTTAPVLIELFTSQGCSSCPPADALAARLERDPSLVVIARPVTYWDNLGWKDTFARAENTDLQRSYSIHAGRGGQVYTPQVVIDGEGETIGSQAGAIARLVDTARQPSGASLAVIAGTAGSFGAGIDGTANRPAELMLVALRSRAPVAIGRGENAGRTVAYTNVVLGERRLGGWGGGRKAFPIGASLLTTPGADRYALILREPDGGKVLAARYLPS